MTCMRPDPIFVWEKHACGYWSEHPLDCITALTIIFTSAFTRFVFHACSSTITGHRWWQSNNNTLYLTQGDVICWWASSEVHFNDRMILGLLPGLGIHWLMCFQRWQRIWADVIMQDVVQRKFLWIAFTLPQELPQTWVVCHGRKGNASNSMTASATVNILMQIYRACCYCQRATVELVLTSSARRLSASQHTSSQWYS